MNKALTYQLAVQSATRALIRRFPQRIDYTRPVRYPFLPYGHQATLLYDTDLPILQRLVDYEQRQYELTGKTPEYCTKELNLSEKQTLQDLTLSSILAEQQRRLEISQWHQETPKLHKDIPCAEPYFPVQVQNVLSQAPGVEILHIRPLRPPPLKEPNKNEYPLATNYQCQIMAATVPSPSTTDMPEDIKKQTPEEHVNAIPDHHLPDDPDKAQEVREVLLQATGALSLYKFDIGYIDPEIFGYATIDTGDSKPHYEPPRRFSHLEREALHHRVREYRHSGICGDSISPWASNPLLVPKKDTEVTFNDFRLCIDLRGLNNVTVPDRHPLPRIEELTASVRGCPWLSTLDLKSAYNSYLIKPSDRKKTAFYAGDWGLQEFQRLSMGLTNAPAQWQRLIEKMFADYIGIGDDNDPATGEHKRPFLKIYLDDLIVYSKTWAEHKRHLHLVMQRLQSVGLKLNADKGYFGQKEVTYCGFVISGNGTRPNTTLCDAINNYPRPKNIKHVMAFLGMVNFFRNYIEKFADIAAPLYGLTKIPYNKRKPTDIQDRWNDDHERAFQGLKEALMSEPVLAQPDFTKPFTLHTDASGEALGAVLTQDDEEGNPRAIGYASRILSDVERRYSATESECLAVIWACENFRHYLHGHHFHLYSDHQALQFLMGGGASRSTNRKHHRWLAELQTYNFTICHRPGVDNVVPDALSRCYQLTAEDRSAYLSALLVLTLGQHDYTLKHRPLAITTPPNPEEQEVVSVAACLAYAGAKHWPAPTEHQVQEVAKQANTRVLDVDGDPEHLAALLAAPFSVSPVTVVADTDIIIIPDPSRLRHTAHEKWIQYLDLYATTAYLAPTTPTGIPHLAISRSTTENQGTSLFTISAKEQEPPVVKIQRAVVPLPRKPLHLMELCGGLGTFLEALLRNGYIIQRYTYVDSDPMAQKAIRHRLWRLHAKYPRQLPVNSFQDYDSLPQDVHRITARHLRSLPPVDLLAAGPPCQNFSSAGNKLGWRGKTSHVFPAVLQILQHLQTIRPTSYVIENVPAATAFPAINDSLGPAILGNAIDHGSAARRLTAFWTNISEFNSLQKHMDTPSVQKRWTIRQFLEDLGLDDWATHASTPGYFNKFVRVTNSHAHRLRPDGSPGPSQLIYKGTPVELPPMLRATAMGFDPWDTKPPATSDADHHQLLGNAIDINLATHFIRHTHNTPHLCCGACTVMQRCQFDKLCDCAACAAEPVSICPVQSGEAPHQEWKDVACAICYDTQGEDNMAVCETCGITIHLRCLSPPRQTPPSGTWHCPACDPHGVATMDELYMPHTPLEYAHNDPYQDIDLLNYLEHQTIPQNKSKKDTQGFLRRASAYRRHPAIPYWIQVNKGARKKWRTVPPVEYRLDLIRVHHDAAAHSGARTTLDHVQHYFTWLGVAADVQQFVRDCDTCQRRNRPQLVKDPQPFDLYGPFEHVLMDSCGPFWLPNPAYTEEQEQRRRQRNRAKTSTKETAVPKRVKAWVIVIVDYFTKVAEFAVVTNHSSTAVAAAAYDHWLSRYPKPRKWTVDQGPENKGAVQQLMHKLGIRLVTTAVFNPTANGACERLVQSLKRMLGRMIGNHETAWLSILPHVRAAYMRRVHTSTGFSPIHMLTGLPVEPLLPLGDLLNTSSDPQEAHTAFMEARSRQNDTTCSAPSLHSRTDIDIITDRDQAWMLQNTQVIPIASDNGVQHPYISILGVATEMQSTLEDLERDLQLTDLVPSLLKAKQHFDATETERQHIYAKAREKLTTRQRIHRERYIKMLQLRPASVTYHVLPEDLVLIHNQDSEGLRAPLMGPFRVVRITKAGNIIVCSDPTSSTNTTPVQWSVAPDRVYPYRFENQCYDIEQA